MSYPNGLKRHCEYDANGRLVKSEDVKGNTTQYQWDKAGNPSNSTAPAAS